MNTSCGMSTLPNCHMRFAFLLLVEQLAVAVAPPPGYLAFTGYLAFICSRLRKAENDQQSAIEVFERRRIEPADGAADAVAARGKKLVCHDL